MKKPVRADAVRNRQRVLEVAQEVFAEEGLVVPIDEIARRAGLGVGTLYRHFPTKEALFEAIVLTRLQDTIDDARALADAADPGAAFFDFLLKVIDEGVKKRDFVDALSGGGDGLHRALASLKKELHRAMGTLLTRAQDASEVRPDVTIADVAALISGIFQAIEQRGGDARTRRHLIAILCDGLRKSN